MPDDEPHGSGQIAHVWQASSDSKTPSPVLPELHELLEYAMLASESRPTNPMERAIVELGGQHLPGTERLHPVSPTVLGLTVASGLLSYV